MNSSIQKSTTLQESYQKDIDGIAEKSRFGYFSLAPSCFLAKSPPQPLQIKRNSNGKVQTENRNIFSGVTASGVLKKNYFSYSPSHIVGDLYQDPSKIANASQLKEAEKYKDKEAFKPNSYPKEPSASLTYGYLNESPIQNDKKVIKDVNGKVKTNNPNVKVNNSNKSYQNRLDLYKNKSTLNLQVKISSSQKKQKAIKKKDELCPFILGSICGSNFTKNKQIYEERHQTEKKLMKSHIIEKRNEEPFIPSNHSNSYKLNFFSKPEYIAPSVLAQPVSKAQSLSNLGDKKQAFKSNCALQVSKPTPSISLSKVNILRAMR